MYNLWWPWCGILIGRLVPGACLWLGLLWLSFGVSLALVVCGLWALFFVSSCCVALVESFLCSGALLGWEASRFVFFCVIKTAESRAKI